MVSAKLNVAICGGGIAGLVTAIALARLSKGNKDIRIEIFESAQAFSEIGAGVGMSQRPWNVMKALQLEGALKKIAEVPKNDNEPHRLFSLRKSDRTEGVSFFDVVLPMTFLLLYRPDFLDVLSGEIDHDIVTIHFSKRLISYGLSPDSSARLTTLSFKDGSTSTCDILIGADGINSAVRGTMLELAAKEAELARGEEAETTAQLLRDVIKPVWSGTFAYRGVIPSSKLAKLNPNHSVIKEPQNYTGKDKHLIAFPMKTGQLINVVALCSWPDKDGTVFEGKTVEERTQSELLEQYQGWEEEVQQLLQCMEKPSRWVINNLKPLPISMHGPVALIGDACHAMTPHLGSGAGQAIEDAYILASLLAHPSTTRESLQEALKVYETVCLPHALMVQRLSRLNGRVFEFIDPRFEDFDNGGRAKNREISAEDMQKLNELGLAAMKNWEWQWSTDVEDDRKKAIELLEERVGSSTLH